MRITKLFFTYFSNILSLSLIFNLFIDINEVKFYFFIIVFKKEINHSNLFLAGTFIGLFFSYLYHYLIELLALLFIRIGTFYLNSNTENSMVKKLLIKSIMYHFVMILSMGGFGYLSVLNMYYVELKN